MAWRHIRPDIAGDPSTFPEAAAMGRLEMPRDFDPRTRRALARMWTEIRVR